MVAKAVVLNKVSIGEVPAKLALKCFKNQDQPLQEVRRSVNAATQAEEGLVAVCQTLSQTISNISAVAESSAVVDLDDYHFATSADGSGQLSEMEATPSEASQHIAGAMESLLEFAQVQRSRQA